MFINDDGLQIIDEDERRARIEFYADHSIGWTARPKHGKDGFVRKGKFKKVRLSFCSMWQRGLDEQMKVAEIVGSRHISCVCPSISRASQSGSQPPE